MEIQKKVVTIRDVDYEVRELLAKDLRVLWSDDNEDGSMTQDHLFGLSVWVDGKQIGNDIDDMPAAVYMRLLKVVNELNKDVFATEGND